MQLPTNYSGHAAPAPRHKLVSIGGEPHALVSTVGRRVSTTIMNPQMQTRPLDFRACQRLQALIDGKDSHEVGQDRII